MTGAGIGNAVLDDLLGERKVIPKLELLDALEIGEEGDMWVEDVFGKVWKGVVLRSTTME